MSLSRRMALAGLVFSLVVIVPAVIVLRAFDSFDESQAVQQQGDVVVRAADRVLGLAIDLETGSRGYVITGEQSFLVPWTAARDELPGRARDLVEEATQGARRNRLARLIAERATTYLSEYSVPQVALARRNREAAASRVKTQEGKRRVDVLRRLTRRLTVEQTAINHAAANRAERAADRAEVASIVGLATSLLAILGLYLYLYRGVSRPLHRLTYQAERFGTGDLTARAERGGPREIDQLAATFNDMAASLERSRAELERVSDAKSDFLSRMSHELRTPLNAVIGFGQLLEMSELEQDDVDSVRQVLHAGRHLLSLIDEVLDISRIEGGTLRISVEPVPVADAIAEAQSMIGPLAAERAIDLTVEPTQPDIHAYADQQRLKQILLNLLANAIHYNRPGGSVSVRTKVEAAAVHVMVTDTGPGIASEHLDKLFAPFERLGADQSDVQGTGLGLALSRRLAELMEGTLLVTDTSSLGTTFTLTLRRAIAQTETEEGPVTSEPHALQQSDQLTVIYIEDNMSNFKLVERIFARARPVRLLTAIQGSLGIELIRRHRPDLVLLDLHLPDMTGDQVLAQIKADPETSSIPIVVISADATSGQIERLRAAGAAAYLTKPLDVNEFVDTIESVTAQPDAV